MREQELGYAQTRRVKGLVLGSTGAGKTNLTECLIETFDERYHPTIGFDCKIHNFIQGKQKISVELWDASAQEKFRPMSTVYYQKIEFILLCFDLTSQQSFDELTSVWLKEIEKNVKDKSKVQIFLVGTKADLGNQREVSEEKARNFAAEHGYQYYETSAKTKWNVKELLQTAAGINIQAKAKPQSNLSVEKAALISDIHKELLTFADRVSGALGGKPFAHNGITRRYPTGVFEMLIAYQNKSGDDLLRAWQTILHSALQRGPGQIFKRLLKTQTFYEDKFAALNQALGMSIDQDLNIFKKQYPIIDKIIQQAGAEIKYDSQGNLLEDQNPNLKIKTIHEGSPYQYYEDPSTYPKEVNKVVGFNKIIGNNQLFLSASPRTMSPHNPKEYIYNMLSHVNALVKHSCKKIKIIVLGHTFDDHMENLSDYYTNIEDTYTSHLAKIETHPERFTFEYTFAITPDSNDPLKKREAEILYINSKNNQFFLSPQDLEQLYQLIELQKESSAQRKAAPIIVHCAQGLDRAPTIVFAMELYRNFDYVFSYPPTTPKRIEEAYKKLRQSRSPITLQGLDNFKTAVLLAFNFKAIDLVKKTNSQLEFYKSKLKTETAKICFDQHINWMQAITELSHIKPIAESAAKIDAAYENSILAMFARLFSSSEITSLFTTYGEALVAQKNLQTKLYNFMNIEETKLAVTISPVGSAR